MKKDKISEELKKYAELLKSESVETIDFDVLINVLSESSAYLSDTKILSDQYNTLKEDIILRISGMEKAITALKRTKSGMDELTGLLDELNMSDAAQLLSQYKKTQARFRDAFPTSFGMMNNKGSYRDLSVFK